MIEPDARTRASWGNHPNQPSVRLIAGRVHRKGKLRGFVTAEILPVGLKIADITIIQGRAGFFAGLPARPVLDSDGHHRRNDAGKPQYAAIIEWSDRAVSDRFSATLIALVRRAYPEMFVGVDADVDDRST
jgi:hypothetical protein